MSMSTKSWSRHGTGVSVSQVGQSWRFRWKELDASGTRKSREKNIPMARCTVHQQKKVKALIEEALGTPGGVPDDIAAFLDPVIASPAASLVDGVMTYAKHAPKALAAKSKENNTSLGKQVIAAIYMVLGVPSSQPLPVTVLGRDLFLRLKSAGLKSSVHKLRFLLRAWQWMYGDLDVYTKCPAPPTGERMAEYVPSRVSYGETTAPTFDHCDAMLRALARSGASDVTKMGALWARYLGCRISEVLPVHKTGITLSDEENMSTVFLPGTKNESAPRTIPLPENLLNEPGVMDWIESHAGPMFPSTAKRQKIDEPVKLAWLDATARGECPRAVWDPSADMTGLGGTAKRKISRPNHAMRACVNEHLRTTLVSTGKVDPTVRARLMGRKGDVEATHYSGDLNAEMNEAMATIPSVDWTGKASTKPQAVPGKRRHLHAV